MNKTATVSASLTIAEDGRTTIPDKIRSQTDMEGKQAFCNVENYGHAPAEKPVRVTVTLGDDGRLTVPEEVRKQIGIYSQKVFCNVENHGPNKLLITILSGSSRKPLQPRNKEFEQILITILDRWTRDKQPAK